MAGVKGRSGGARSGAGRKPKDGDNSAQKGENLAPVVLPDFDMLEMLQKVALGRVEATPLQVRAAIAAVQYTHTKRADGGKKEEREEMAKKAAGGKFSASAPPKLVAAGGKKL